MIDTNESLLERVRRVDAHEAWREFYLCYASAILRYARKLGLDQHRAEEVLQETMVALMDQMPQFTYDRQRGRFRNFLLTIVHRKSLAVIRRAARSAASQLRRPGGIELCGDELVAVDLRDDDRARWREVLLEEALVNLGHDAALEENTLAVFKAYAIEGRPAREVALRYGLQTNAVYQIKNRLMRRLRAEVARRLRDSGTEDGRWT